MPGNSQREIMPFRAFAFIAALCLASSALGGPPPALVELQIGDRKYEGKVVAKSPAAYWIVGQEGRMSVFDAKEVTKSRQISPQFHGWNPSIVKDQLQREFARPYDVASTRHYVVVASSSDKARRYSDMLEDFFSTFRMYFSVRGFNVPEPEFPLVAIVFPDQQAFGKYAERERQKLSRMVRGYYMPTSNRIAFFETGGDVFTLREPHEGGRSSVDGRFRIADRADAADGTDTAKGRSWAQFDIRSPHGLDQTRIGENRGNGEYELSPLSLFSPVPTFSSPFTASIPRGTSDPGATVSVVSAASASSANLLPAFDIGPIDPSDSIEASLKDTMIHEATHQAAFNTGLHSRIGANPVWMVEGLATVFEAPGVRSSRNDSGVKSRINRERLMWFGNFVKERRKPQSLEAFLAADDLFRANPLDAYSQAWALTFYLFETRPRNYAEYLRTVAGRNPLELYTPEARVADFKKAISQDLKLLEAEFLRFIADIR